MIDFIKAVWTVPCYKEVVNKMQGRIYSKLYHDGELQFPYEIDVSEQYKVKIFEGVAQKHYLFMLTGSLHKNHHNGNNYKRFTYKMLLKEIEFLEKVLGLNAKDLKLQNLEIAVNIKTQFKPYQFLKKNLLLYHCNPFEAYNVSSNVRLEYYSDTYPSYKIYDKGMQFSLPINLLRLELKYKKSEGLNKYGIYNLNDLRLETFQLRFYLIHTPNK